MRASCAGHCSLELDPAEGLLSGWVWALAHCRARRSTATRCRSRIWQPIYSHNEPSEMMGANRPHPGDRQPPLAGWLLAAQGSALETRPPA